MDEIDKFHLTRLGPSEHADRVELVFQLTGLPILTGCPDCQKRGYERLLEAAEQAGLSDQEVELHYKQIAVLFPAGLSPTATASTLVPFVAFLANWFSDAVWTFGPDDQPLEHTLEGYLAALACVATNTPAVV